MGSKKDERRDVHIIYNDGRTDTFTGVREETSRHLEDLPFDEKSGVKSSSSGPTRSNRRD